MGGNSQQSQYAEGFSPKEMMIIAASREIKEGDLVFVGMRFPLLAFLVAKRLHSPNAVALYENGVIRETPSEGYLYTMGDPPNITGATSCCDTGFVMDLLHQGRVDIGFLGAGEVDRFGNLNSTFVRREDGSVTRLPGSGGACDIASLAKGIVVIVPHRKNRLVERVFYITSPGYIDGDKGRERAGLPRGGTRAIITDKAVFRFDRKGEAGERQFPHGSLPSETARLDSIHIGVSTEEVISETSWKVEAEPYIRMTDPPTEDELEALRYYDPEGFWTSSSG